MSETYLTAAEASALEAFEEERSRGDSVHWDEPKSIKGVVCREVETVEFTDRNDGSSASKRVLALRTADGIVTVWEGPGMLRAKLFDGEQQNGDPLGPPRKAQLVVIDYRGERTSQAGREYKFFDVAIGPAPGEAEEPPAIPDDEADIIAAALAEKENTNDDIPF